MFFGIKPEKGITNTEASKLIANHEAALAEKEDPKLDEWEAFEEIIDELKKSGADLVAIDAPLTFEGKNRACDDELRVYGALPPTLKGMTTLADRGTKLAVELKKLNFNVIEVFPTASAKILGFHDKNQIDGVVDAIHRLWKKFIS